MTFRRTVRPRRVLRRGFNLVELLLALAISAALLAATMSALNACFIAYQATTEEASSQTISRLIMHRVLTMVRTGTDFGPMPDDPLETTTTGDSIEFRNATGQLITISFDDSDGTLSMQVDDDDPRVLLRGVRRTEAGEGESVPAFTMEWEKGTHLYRVTMDVTVADDDSQRTKADLGYVKPIRLVASATPRSETW
jgi:prepilin-type N-terminal cleavage/methylation domain-containing protein